jgi:predicted amidohydrolase YtcJ
MPNTVYVGGRVLVGDGATTPANAVVLREGRVAAVGTRDAMVRIAGRGAEQVDVHGATILPGLVDTHPHLMHFGTFAEPLVDIADARSHDDIVELIRARAADTPAGEWIMTIHGRPSKACARTRRISASSHSFRATRSSLRSTTWRAIRC